MKYLLPLIAMGLMLCVSNSLVADVTISVEVDPPVDAGDIARVSFFGSSTTGQQISGLNIPVDIGPVGVGLPAELSFLGATGTNDIDSPSVENEIGGVAGGLNTNSTFLTLNNTDAIVNVIGFPAVTLSTTDTLLFDLLLQVDSAAPIGSFPVAVNNGDTNGNGFSFNVLDESGGEISSADVSVVSGSVNIIGVPEPGSLTLICFISGYIATRRRRS